MKNGGNKDARGWGMRSLEGVSDTRKNEGRVGEITV